eukprot:Blabericola_migrator_1__10893@NODE_628_length_7173_cov_74_949901_g459_i0_p2_GENE_NODE_628_length_7173_cov_74_949901_g459_i0NODE_628_length_7173_cov_74_949901_g459_i0_p2_ORF_typecomplete_len279_score31_05SRPRB/PF09439_10/5_4e31Arf/PF00025_21/6_6e14FeoB_N/PF02421_18/0_00029NACHT/PF05729_12/0_00014MMR_HSR1/PF01926_23/0_00025Ras/PF00071_22/0_0019Gtr1_RagA/PF04670_12/0_0037AAA_22/PF13401_6/0_0044PRK/PF00485_18/0_0087AAA_16/PF13191_6/0_013KTI12/PF08433_10/0_011Roc/PF08477_13/0_024Sulfotransfer_3/PF134
MNIFVIFIVGCLGLAILLFLQYHAYSVSRGLLTETSESLKILILGLPNSGKTVLWQRLTSELPARPTVTSLEPNEAFFVPSRAVSDALTPTERKGLFGRVLIRDVPGRLDHHHDIIDKELPSASAIVFLIDSCDNENIRSAANFLYNILSSQQYQVKPKPICLCLNKQGLANARHRNLLREDLEREIEKLRRLHDNHKLDKAEMPPLPKSFVAGLLSYCPLRWTEQPKQVKVELMKTPATMFRLSNINSPYFLLVQDPSQEVVLDRLKGFIQRASLLP